MYSDEQESSPWQNRFQNTCRAFVDETEALANHVRQNPDSYDTANKAVVYQGIMSLWVQVAKLKDTGLDMVAQSPRCPLVLEERRYWFIGALTDQTEFENECDDLETSLDQWGHRILRGEVDNLWVAGFLESTAMHITGQFQLVRYLVSQSSK
ncbi:hypothetical protein N7475_009261 [Penicillium sp. IBT 31633x]|nr:hypothetical protein N7475_009261 [Penicillium sp. IBT 31633x]